MRTLWQFVAVVKPCIFGGSDLSRGVTLGFCAELMKKNWVNPRRYSVHIPASVLL